MDFFLNIHRVTGGALHIIYDDNDDDEVGSINSNCSLCLLGKNNNPWRSERHSTKPTCCAEIIAAVESRHVHYILVFFKFSLNLLTFRKVIEESPGYRLPVT